MKKYCVEIEKRLKVKVPVEAESLDEAYKAVDSLIARKDTGFIFEDYDPDCWQVNITFTRNATDEEFEKLSEDCEVVKSDGTHDWR